MGIGCHWVCVDHKKGLEALRILWFYGVLWDSVLWEGVCMRWGVTGSVRWISQGMGCNGALMWLGKDMGCRGVCVGPHKDVIGNRGLFIPQGGDCRRWAVVGFTWAQKRALVGGGVSQGIWHHEVLFCPKKGDEVLWGSCGPL